MVGDYGNCCCFALTRGFERTCAASSEQRAAHDTDASILAAVDEPWHIALLCQLLVCGVHVLDGTETHEDKFEENAQTEAGDARCLHASELGQWSKKARIPVRDEKTCLRTVSAAHVNSAFLCLDDRKRDDIKLSKRKKTHTQDCHGAVGTSTHVACALTSKPHFSSFTPPVSPARSKNHKICSSSSVAVSFIAAQLDEQSVRVGVLLLRAVELFHALGGLLVAQAHAVEEPSDPPLAGTHLESLCFEPFVQPSL